MPSPAIHDSKVFDPSFSNGLFVGVSSFDEQGIPEVAFAVDDAVDLAHLFGSKLQLIPANRIDLALAGEPKKRESRDRLKHLLEQGARQTRPTRSKVLKAVHDLVRTSHRAGLMVLSVATHGLSHHQGDFLLAADSLPEDMSSTGIHLEKVLDRVSAARAERRLVLVDACREHLLAGQRGLIGTPMSQSFAEAIRKASGQVVLSAATIGGFAYENPERGNGVFSCAILDGLSGAAPTNEHGFITVRTLATYLQEQVNDWVEFNKPSHRERSRGIAMRIEGAAQDLPLAQHSGQPYKPPLVERISSDAQERAPDAVSNLLRPKQDSETLPGRTKRRILGLVVMVVVGVALLTWGYTTIDLSKSTIDATTGSDNSNTTTEPPARQPGGKAPNEPSPASSEPEPDKTLELPLVTLVLDSSSIHSQLFVDDQLVTPEESWLTGLKVRVALGPHEFKLQREHRHCTFRQQISEDITIAPNCRWETTN